jgi:hypothetical protein
MSMHGKKNRPTRAFLLRCWQEGKAPGSDEIDWRYSLEGVVPKRCRQGFDDLESLVAFLRGELTDGGDESREVCSSGSTQALAPKGHRNAP